MQALVLQDNGSLLCQEWPTPQPQAGEVLLQIHAAALNRRDLWITKGMYPGLTPPVVLGSDGVGTVTALGDGVDEAYLGQRFVINPSIEWGPKQACQGASFNILGNPRDGTFAEFVAVPVEWLCEVPAHLSDDQAAALPLAGLTAYRALVSRAAAQAGDRVLITGAGGGVAQMALMFAVALGCKVAVTSSSAAKRDAALAAGAELAFDYREADWGKQLRKAWGGIDVAIDGNVGDGFATLVQIADFGARIVVYGATVGEPSGLPMRQLFWKQVSILGSTMGSAADFAAMVALVSQQRLCPTVDGVFAMADYAAALARMEEGAHLGKIILHPVQN